MKLLRVAGTTSNILQVFIADSSSTTGAGLTGLVFNSASLTAYYHRDTDTTATAISLVTMTVGTYTSGGFKEIDATNMPGWYQFCPPDAALASGASSVGFHLKGATNMAPLPIEVDLAPTVILGNSTAHGGASAVITAERIVVASTTSGQPALKLTGSGAGEGVKIAGGTTGKGVSVAGGTGAVGTSVTGGSNAVGLVVQGGSNAYGATFTAGNSSSGTIAGVLMTGGGGSVGGHGLQCLGTGGAASAGLLGTGAGEAGIKAVGQGVGEPGFLCIGGSGGPGIYSRGVDIGHGVVFEGVGGGADFVLLNSTAPTVGAAWNAATLATEATGRPATNGGALRRVLEKFSNKRTRNRTTGVKALRNATDTADLESSTQSSPTVGGAIVDTETQGA